MCIFVLHTRVQYSLLIFSYLSDWSFFSILLLTWLYDFSFFRYLSVSSICQSLTQLSWFTLQWCRSKKKHSKNKSKRNDEKNNNNHHGGLISIDLCCSGELILIIIEIWLFQICARKCFSFFVSFFLLLGMRQIVSECKKKNQNNELLFLNEKMHTHTVCVFSYNCSLCAFVFRSFRFVSFRFVCVFVFNFSRQTVPNCFVNFFLIPRVVCTRYCFATVSVLVLLLMCSVEMNLRWSVVCIESNKLYRMMNFAWVCVRVCACVSVFIGVDLIRAREIVWMEWMTSEHSKI